MKELVEGDWKDFSIRIPIFTEYEAIIESLRETYYKEEICHKLLGWSEVKRRDLDLVIRTILPHNFTLCAFHKETNQVAGVRMMIDSRKKLDFMRDLNLQSEDMRRIWTVKAKLIELERKSPVPRFVEDGKENYAAGFLTSVSPKYRKLGIASELTERSLSLLRREGFYYFKCFFSSPITQGIARSMGFHTLAAVHLAEMVDDKGEKLFTKAGPPPEYYITYMALQL